MQKNYYIFLMSQISDQCSHALSLCVSHSLVPMRGPSVSPAARKALGFIPFHMVMSTQLSPKPHQLWTSRVNLPSAPRPSRGCLQPKPPLLLALGCC